MPSTIIGKIPFGYIYVSFFPATESYPSGAFYIGQRKRPEFDKYYYGSGKLVGNWINKHGASEIKTILLCWAYSFEELNDLEYYWVSDYYNHKKHPDCLNLVAGGHRKGESEETKYKQRMGRLGIKLTPEQRENVRRGRLNFMKTPEYEKVKQLNRETKLGDKAVNSKQIYCFETKKVYGSLGEAARELGVNYAGIGLTLRGYHKHTGGYTFKQISRQELKDYICTEFPSEAEINNARQINIAKTYKNKPPMPLAVRQKLSIAAKGHPSYTKGKKLPRSEETKRRTLEKVGGINHPGAMPVLWVEGNKVFPCLKYCCKELGLPLKSFSIIKNTKKFSCYTLIHITKEEYLNKINFQ